MALIVRGLGGPIPDNDTVYNDSAIAERISAAEARVTALANKKIPKVVTVATMADVTKALSGEEKKVEITLEDNLSLTTALTVPAEKEVTFKLGNNKLSTTNNSGITILGKTTIEGGSIEGPSYVLNIHDGGNLTVTDTTITSSKGQGITSDGNSSVTLNDVTITSQESSVAVFDHSDVTINGGSFTGIDNFAVSANGSPGRGGGNVVIDGATITGHIKSAGYIACGVYWPNEGTLTIKNTTINSDGAGVVIRGGTVNIDENVVINATGTTGVKGKVGDSRVVVGPYAVVYDANSKYPAMNTMELNIAADAQLTGTDGDIDIMLIDGVEANIHDNRSNGGEE